MVQTFLKTGSQKVAEVHFGPDLGLLASEHRSNILKLILDNNFSPSLCGPCPRQICVIRGRTFLQHGQLLSASVFFLLGFDFGIYLGLLKNCQEAPGYCARLSLVSSQFITRLVT